MPTVPMTATQAREVAISALSSREGSAVVARILTGRTDDVKAIREMAKAYVQTQRALPKWNARGDYDRRPYEAIRSLREALCKMVESIMTNDEISTHRPGTIADTVRSYWTYQNPAN